MMNDKNYEEDYEYTREALYDLIEKGRTSIEEMMEVARNSEHPRAYEVLSKLIKDVGDVSDKIMELNKQRKDLEKDDNVKQLGNTTNNVFIGSTTELQRFLQQNREVDVTPDATE